MAVSTESAGEAKLRAASTYNAAADFFDAPALAFWQRIGRRTVERMSLSQGASVLDACCGSGASAIPAAQAVGANGRLLGVDLAENLLRLARLKAANLRLSHVDFHQGDIEALAPSAEVFDAVICVFGIFFLPDMLAGARHLWQLVRPGGQLAVTSWGPHVLEPGSTAFWNAVRKERPDLYKGFHSWDRISDPNSLFALLSEAGAQPNEVVEEFGAQPISSPEDFWTIALGSGYRATIDQLDGNQRDRVRQATLTYLSKNNVRSVETNVIYAVSRKPQ
jgi:ubiquinone/menaquinone biosynthesis C-methylase UbiE